MLSAWGSISENTAGQDSRQPKENNIPEESYISQAHKDIEIKTFWAKESCREQKIVEGHDQITPVLGLITLIYEWNFKKTHLFRTTIHFYLSAMQLYRISKHIHRITLHLYKTTREWNYNKNLWRITITSAEYYNKSV